MYAKDCELSFKQIIHLESLALGSMLLATVSGVCADVDLARIEEFLGVDSSNADAFAEGTTRVTETAAELLRPDETGHGSLTPLLWLRGSDSPSAATVTARGVILDSVGITDQVVATLAANTLTTLSAVMKD